MSEDRLTERTCRQCEMSESEAADFCVDDDGRMAAHNWSDPRDGLIDQLQRELAEAKLTIKEQAATCVQYVHEIQRLEGEVKKADANFSEFRTLSASIAGERFGVLREERNALESRLDAALRVVEAARLLRNHIAEFGELEPAMWGESYDNLDTALAELERASTENQPK